MARDTSRRDEVAQAATDYVLEHGLVGLSLRPLAAELGTSDRMLLYHFASKDDLVATVLRVSNDRSVAEIRGAAAVAGRAQRGARPVGRGHRRRRLARCQRMYVEAAALGLFGREPYATRGAGGQRGVGRGGRRPPGRLRARPRERARRAVALLDAALMGFQLDLPLDAGDPVLEQAVLDLADAVAAIACQV